MESRAHSQRSAAHPCLWSPTIGGMDGVEEMDAGQPVFVLLQNETLIWDMERRRRKRRRAGRRRSGLQEGVWSFWFKMRFSFIYLFSWAHSSRLSACFLLYVLWPQCPLPPPPAFFCVSNVSGSASANMCVYVRSCTFTLLLLLPVFVWLCMCVNAVWVRLFCVSQQCLLLYATVSTAYVFICKKWESVLAVQGWMVSFGIDLFYYVCASHAVQLSHTQAKATYPSCWRAQCPKTAQIMPRSENKSCFVLLFFFFTSSHWHFHQPH